MTHQHLLQVLRKKVEGGPDPYPDYSLASAGLKESSASTLSPYQQSQRSPYLHFNVGMLQGSVGGQLSNTTCIAAALAKSYKKEERVALAPFIPTDRLRVPKGSASIKSLSLRSPYLQYAAGLLLGTL